MALSLVGTDFRRSQDQKRVHRRNRRKVQDGGPRLESSRRHAADDQRWDVAPRSGSLLWHPRPFSARSETGRGRRTNHSQYSSLLPKYDLPTHPTQMGRRLSRRRSARFGTGLASQARPLAQVQGTYSVSDVSSLRQKDAWQMLDALVQPFRTIVLIGLCFGLRISEILGLRWTDFDFKRSVVLVQRSAVGKRLNKLKTEYSQDEVPIERGFILELKKWQALCLDTEEHWLFPSPVTGRPYHADSMRNDYLVPTGLKLGLGRIGWHTFRHTYRAWLDETGAPVGVQQKLMRHAHVSTTMDQYGNASALAKRKANRPIVQRLLQRPANQEVSIQ